MLRGISIRRAPLCREHIDGAVAAIYPRLSRSGRPERRRPTWKTTLDGGTVPPGPTAPHEPGAEPTAERNGAVIEIMYGQRLVPVLRALWSRS